MKRVFAVLLMVFLCGCQTPPVREVETIVVPRRLPAEKPVEAWLLKRQRLCQLPDLELRARLKLRIGDGEAEESPMERLMLASCNPEQTPGLLYEALAALPQDLELTPAEAALVELIRDYAGSYRTLEQQRQNLRRKLEKTIEGIQQIEAEIDGLQSNGAVQ